MRPPFVLTIATFLFTSSVLAATHTWHGAVDNRFSTAANWIGGSPAGDPDADLYFVENAVRTTLLNDIPNLPFHSMGFGGTGYSVMGEPLAADESSIGGGGAAIYCDVTVARHLNLGGVVLKGAISGPGDVAIISDVTFTGFRSNTYTGETVVRSRLVLAKTNGAIAVAGNIRSFEGADHIIRVAVNAPEQIADSATVDLSAGPGDLFINADETIHSLSIGTYVFVNTAATVIPTLTVDTLNVTGRLEVQTNLHITAPDVQVPAGTSIFGRQKLTLPESGVTLHGGGSVTWQGGPTTYSAPVRIDGPLMQIINFNSPVELVAGKFWGSARSLTATGGTIEYVAKSATDIRANASTQFEYFQTFDGGFTPITLNGTLDLGNATLLLDPAVRRLRETSFLIQNASSQPVIGTFNGLPEGAIVANHWRISYHGGDGNDVTVTDLAHPQPTITFSQNPAPGIVGQPVTITATLSGSNGVPTGTLTFLPDGGPPVDVPITNGTATLQATYDALPVSGLRTSYSGDSTYASTTGFFEVQVKYPKPVVTSVTPPDTAAGSRVMLVIRGTGFFPESFFGSSTGGIPPLPTTFVSPTELRAVLDLSGLRFATSLFFQVHSPSGSSDLVRINVRALSNTPPLIQFDSTSASATLTTGTKSAWISSDAVQTTTFISDDDFDGIVRWTWDHLPSAAFTVVDLNNGTFATKASGTATTTPAPIPAHTFVYDPSGFLTRIALPVTGPNPSSTWTVLWVRPSYVVGAGAWTTTITGTTLLTGSIATMQPLGDSPKHPDAFWEGDIVVLMPRGASGQNIRVFASVLGSDIYNDAPGVLQMTYAVFPANEADKKALVPVTRDRSATTVSVRYRTIPRTALPGIQYSDVTGVLTFAPGEKTKNIEVPLIDDAVYNPGSFDVQLFDPSGTSLVEPAETRVNIIDDDPHPVVSLVGPATRTILRNPQLTGLPLEFALTGATALPVTVSWEGAGQGSFVFAPGEHYKTILIPIEPQSPGSLFRIDVLSIRLTATGGASLAPDRIAISLVPVTVVRVRANGVTVSETGGSAKVTLSYLPPIPPNQFLILNYETANGSATAGSDYTAVHGSITLTTAQPQQTIDIPISDDATVEGDESFTLSLTKDSFTSDSLLEQSNVPIVISDDEVTTRPSLSIASAASVAEKDDVTNAQIAVRLSAASTLPVRVHYATADGSATGGVDYQSFDDVLTFAPGETVKTISIPIFGDDVLESSESFTITLSLAENATIGMAQSTVTITDDDQALTHRRAK